MFKFRRDVPILAGILTLLAVLFVIGLWPRLGKSTGFAAAPNKTEAPTVAVVAPKRVQAVRGLTLPGTLDAFRETGIYARTNGYVRSRRVDIGDHVKEGQLLAEIDAPEVDREAQQSTAQVTVSERGRAEAEARVAQAEASLRQSRANLELAKATLERYEQLEKNGDVSHQAADEKRTAYNARRAETESMEAAAAAARRNLDGQQAGITVQTANRRRIAQLQDFQRVTAPFAGVITARNIETGALVSSGSTSQVQPLYRLAQISTIRVFVNVPQSDLALVKTGSETAVTLREFPGRTFRGRIVRTSNAFDPATRTLRVEIHVPNEDGALLPGMYADVTFDGSKTQETLTVPTSAILVRQGAQVVAVVGTDNKVVLKKVTLGRDSGREVEVLSGLTGGEQVVITPNDSVQEGATVSPARS
jgi:multidrug efflux pump subunit AcrA (membrane-fusion protein)